MSLNSLLAAAAACAVAGSLALGSAAPPVAATSGAGLPGPYNAITDVPGIQVGQVQSTRFPYLTGSTVIRTPDAPVAGVDVSGGAPGTWMTDILSPTRYNPGVDAVVLTGGSSWGMDVATGVMRWLEDHGVEGVPIVPGAGIYDLGNGGDERARPTASWGYRAVAEATDGPVRQGTVGAGTGALAGRGDAELKGGVGTASVRLDDGTVVGALVVVNAAGSPVNPKNCSLLGAHLGIGGEFAGLRTPSRAECKDRPGPDRGRSTTIAIVATSASMENGAATRMAEVATGGLARAINPSNTYGDGDTVFAVATGTGPKLGNNNFDDLAALNDIDAAAANALSRAVVHAMLSATSTPQFKSYCDTYPSACRHLGRSGTGKAHDIDTKG
ncbi:P1 family peptidase [Streptomyces meridianus]|uniref:P1 family peptidase n=1 Tax=Streptomyces meridianus TaxID=2938945 RepID=A0ABT0X7F4_9ACTN|nr:P1 family peptidase [Streptomyces meridianus]MCM2578220.1 P1 family peptidase [Streptomyces meridianus]